jgi:RimJ/RimL family protein N-acetyltransferase
VSAAPGQRRTERLLARPPTAADRAAYEAHFTRPKIESWLRPPPLSRFDEGLLDKLLLEDCRHWEENGFGPWVLLEAASGEFAGRGGLAWTRVGRRPEVELPWSVEPRLHGRGLATEAALAAVDFARELALDDLVALTLPTNVASQRVAEKAGFDRDGECDHAGLAHVLFRRGLGS